MERWNEEPVRTKMFIIRQFSRIHFRSKSSYIHNPGPLALTATTAGQLLANAAQRYADRTAIVSCNQNTAITFAELFFKVDHFAVGLRKMNVGLGDAVAIWAPSSIEWIITSLACARLGAILVQLNHSYRSNEMKSCLEVSNAKVLVCGHRNQRMDYYDHLRRIDPNIGKNQRSLIAPSLRNIIMMDEDVTYPGTHSFSNLMQNHSEEELRSIEASQADISMDSILNIQFTSGSTGNAKAAMLSHHNIVNNSYSIGARLKYDTKPHTICVQVPLFHTFGIDAGLYPSLHFGATLVFPTDFYSPFKSLHAIRDCNCNVIYGTPTMFVDLIEQQKVHNVQLNAEIACCGGALTSPALIQDMYKYLMVESVVIFYGMTESTGLTFQTHLHAPREHVINTVGHIVDNIEVKVVDEKDKLVPFGTAGELLVRGYPVMKGYLGDPLKTAEVIDACGWLKTGDKFILHEDGIGQIIGRFKDIIIRGGENIHPKEIEDHLTTHPKIIDSQVIGLPHQRLGEEVCACVRLQDGATINLEEVAEYCRDKLAHYKIPTKLFVLKEYPRTTTGKVQKHKLIQQLQELNGC